MRLNLNFKDATIEQVSQSEFKIIFDLSNMNKPRLSPDARVYIEHLNLPEFRDEAWGERGQLKGYFELRCQNLSHNDYDSEYGNTGSAIIYTSPLTSYKSFTNENPMYISNFKINQAFLSDKLIFTMKVYDNNGDPFDTAKVITDDVDKDSSEYKQYNDAIKALHVINNNRDQVVIRKEAAETDKDTAKVNFNAVSKEYYVRRKILEESLENYENKRIGTGSGGATRRGKLIAKLCRDIIGHESVNDIKYFVEIYNDIGKPPFTVDNNAALLNEYYTAWNEYLVAEAEYEKAKIIVSQLQSSNDKIYTSYTGKFDPDTTNVNTVILSGKKTLPFAVSGTTPTKTGNVTVAYHNSYATTESYFIVSDITQTGGDEIIASDELKIDKSKIESLFVPKTKYYFIKDGNVVPPGVSFPANGSGSVDSKRFALQVDRDGATYSFTLSGSIPTRDFSVTDTIKIDGDKLGGIKGTNDLVLQVKDIYVPPASKDYPFPNRIPFPNKGEINVTIQRDNSGPGDKPYKLIHYDFDKTFGYSAREKIVIPGTELDGDDNTHDAVITVDSVVEPSYSFQIDEKTATHSIPPIIIQKDTSEGVTNASGTAYTSGSIPDNFKLVVTSENGVYKVTKASDDNSTNFTTEI